MPLEDSREVPTPNRDRLEFRKCTRSLFLSFSFSLSLSLSRFFYPRNRITPVPRYVCTQRLPRYFISTKLRGLSQNTAVVHNPRQRFLNSQNQVSNTFTKTNGLACRFEKAPSLSALAKARQRKLIEPLKITDPCGTRRFVRVHRGEKLRGNLLPYSFARALSPRFF